MPADEQCGTIAWAPARKASLFPEETQATKDAFALEKSRIDARAAPQAILSARSLTVGVLQETLQKKKPGRPEIRQQYVSGSEPGASRGEEASALPRVKCLPMLPTFRCSGRDLLDVYLQLLVDKTFA